MALRASSTARGIQNDAALRIIFSIGAGAPFAGVFDNWSWRADHVKVSI